MRHPISDRLGWQPGETGYAGLDPRYVRAERLGTFDPHPAFRDRYDANQLCRVRCDAGEAPELLTSFEHNHEGLGLDSRKLAGDASEAREHLAPALLAEGGQVWTSALMLLSTSSSRNSKARGGGCATSLVHHVQHDPRILQQDGLAILVNGEGPHSLYREPGFCDAIPFREARGAPPDRSTESN